MDYKGFCYEQATGRLLLGCGDGFEPFATCYAGAPGFINDPDADHLRQRGPLPKGVYNIILSEHPRFAAPAFYLSPQSPNAMFGRSGFFIHGGDFARRTSSHGCIVCRLSDRQRIQRLFERGAVKGVLTVVSGRSPE